MDTKKIMSQALKFGPAFVGAAVWGFAKYPEQTAWASDLYSRAFGTIAALYDDWTNLPGYGEPLEAGLDEIRKVPATILDVATGTGYAARLLKHRFPHAEVTGADISEEMIGVAQHASVSDALDIAFEVADSKDLPFADGTFDLVVLMNSIVFPEELMRVTAPGGRALVVYSFAGPWVSMAFSALGARLADAGAEHVWGQTAGMGFYGVARKPGSADSIRKS